MQAMNPCGRMAAARWLQPTPARGKSKSWRSSAVRPTLLAIAVSVVAVLLMVILFDARWTHSGDGGDTTSWVSAGARVLFNSGTCIRLIFGESQIF
ncbi:hypothetical protein GUJ93_ZPchr0004g40031 [Zizania palustris]|uniref:Uncharacterized protein n=1 Tax=Zizania palustris TaxID=103762 RepID=A0A8J5SZR1_ZIZPA|nr:hypothetical protein GUJ93_ZPchr0004g40031 [Zizania palustris]